MESTMMRSEGKRARTAGASGDICKVGTIAVAAAVLLGALPCRPAAAATQRNWTNLVTTATSPQKALDWSDPGNWEGGNAALTKNDIANINNTAEVMYFKMPDDITLGAFHNPWSKTAYLIGKTIRPDSTAYSGNQGAVGVMAGRIRNNVYVYADMKPVKDLSGIWSVCGDLNVPGTLTSSVGNQNWRGDLYANNADEVRKDEVVINSVDQSSTQVNLYAPRGCAAHSNAWSQVEGSPYLKLKDKSIGVVAPGCRVSGAGIPDGTFLRRYYEECSVIELSQPVTETIESNVVNFAAYTPKTYGRITSMNAASNANIPHYLKKFREEDVFEIDVGSFSISTSRKSTIRGDTYPGRYILHRTTGATGEIVFENADLFFAEPTAGTAGFASVKSLTVANGKFARLTVTNEVDAVCTNVAQSTGTVIKEGAGSLRFAYAADCTSSGKVTVKEGVFEAAAQADAGVNVSEIELLEGATYRVAKGLVKVTALTAVAGAELAVDESATLDLTALGALPDGLVLRGPGSILIANAKQIAAVSCVDTPVIGNAKPGLASEVKPDGAVVPEVVGHPAFWVKADTNVTTFKTNGVTCVACWADCRPGETEYYATNDFSQISTPRGYSPSRVSIADGFTCIYHQNDIKFSVYPNEENYRNVYSGLVWNKQITGIRAVFSVVMGSSAQAVLGATRRFVSNNPGDFRRGIGNQSGGGILSPQKAWLLCGDAAACVREGFVAVDGLPRPWNKPYDVSGIEIYELLPNAPGAKADAFAIQDIGGATCSGCQRQFETIVYTNELTQTERAQVYAYLLKKYRGREYSTALGGYDRMSRGTASYDELSVNDSVAVAVADGKVENARRLSGSGTFVKRGAGVFMADLVEGVSLDVREGTLTVHSAATPTVDTLPGNHFVHWDAAATNRMEIVPLKETTTEGVGGEPLALAATNMVVHWYDARFGNDGRHVYGTSYKSSPDYWTGCLVMNQLNGLPAVDYGPLWSFVDGQSNANRRFHEFHLTEGDKAATASPVRSVFLVKNAAAGGNLVLGSSSSSVSGIARQSATAACDVPMVSSSQFVGRLNGADVDPAATGYTGGWDLIGLHTCDSFKAEGLGNNKAFTVTGGMKVGEVMVYTNALTFSEAIEIEAYLNRKWFNGVTPYGSPSAAKRVRVLANATLKVEGSAALAVERLQLDGGTIDGSVVLTEDAVFEVPVDADGMITQTLTVSGEADLSKGGSVLLTGNVGMLKVGDYRLIRGKLADGVQDWTVTGYAGNKCLTLKSKADGLWLKVVAPGLIYIVR